ncbi:hypothetical protein [Endozoicomonas sp. 8E]|nr:hypothetical protein [Endozoicomonas sp. 8E]WOG28929.1 hypothetical protein P6910_04495 [Endozoicomonas sp. 8E]
MLNRFHLTPEEARALINLSHNKDYQLLPEHLQRQRQGHLEQRLYFLAEH